MLNRGGQPNNQQTRSSPIHTDYYADWESADSFEGTVLASSIWWLMWIITGIICAIINPYLILIAALSYPVINNFAYPAFHALVSSLWAHRFSIILVMVLLGLTLISFALRSVGSWAESSGSSTEAPVETQKNVPEKSSVVRKEAADSERNVIQYSAPLIPVFLSKEDECWNNYLSERPGMKDWAEMHPGLASKQKTKICG